MSRPSKHDGRAAFFGGRAYFSSVITRKKGLRATCDQQKIEASLLAQASQTFLNNQIHPILQFYLIAF